jgi:hypothetical protein
MKTKAGIILLLFLPFTLGGLNGPCLDLSNRACSSSPLAMAYYMSKVMIRTVDGKSQYGLLAGIEKDDLILKIGANEERVSCRDISEVHIELGKHSGAIMASGMVLGIYLGNIFFYRAEGQPVAYVSEDSPSALGSVYMNFIFASAGIGLGYLASLFEKGKAVFRFGGEEADRLAEWARLKSFLAGRPGNKKIHLSFQAGQVLTSVFQRYRDVFAGAGYSTEYGFDIAPPGSGRYEYVDPAKKFNLLRKAQLTLSLGPKIDIGAAMVFSGEPGVGGWHGYDYGRQVWQVYKSVGYYAVGIFKPFSGAAPQKLQWNVGVGLGASRIDFELGMHAWGDYPDYEEKWDHYEIAQTVPSALAFTELSFFVSTNTSIGLIADYVIGPSRDIPAYPEWELPGQRIRLGNASIGVVLGMHF